MQFPFSAFMAPPYSYRFMFKDWLADHSLYSLWWHCMQQLSRYLSFMAFNQYFITVTSIGFSASPATSTQLYTTSLVSSTVTTNSTQPESRDRRQYYVTLLLFPIILFITIILCWMSYTVNKQLNIKRYHSRTTWQLSCIHILHYSYHYWIAKSGLFLCSVGNGCFSPPPLMESIGCKCNLFFVEWEQYI